MDRPHEVDPEGDVIIALRNPGATFAEAAIEAEAAGEESPAIATEPPATDTAEEATANDKAPAEVAPAIAADAVFESQSVGKPRKKKKKEKRRKRGRSSAPYCPS
jgi:hypothetical protein